MKFSLNSQGDNINGPATKGNNSEKNEDGEMGNANTNIQMNIGNSGALVIKNTAKMLGVLALAGMVAMAATFGSVSADSPSKSSSYLLHGPNAMDVEYLAKLGKTFMVHGPNAMDIEYLNNLGSALVLRGPDAKQSSASAFRIHGPDVVEQSSVSAFRIHGHDVVEQSTTSAFRIHGPDVAEQSTASVSAFRIHGPDVVEQSSVSAFRIHGPDVVEQSSTSAFRIHGPDVVEQSTAASALPGSTARTWLNGRAHSGFTDRTLLNRTAPLPTSSTAPTLSSLTAPAPK